MKQKWNSFIKQIINKDFLTGTIVLMVGQAITYLLVKFFMSDYHTIESQIDNFIPFIPHMIYFYSIFYPYVFLVLYYVFINDYDNFKKGIIIGTISYLISDIIFLVFPTIMTRPLVIYSNLDWLTAFLIRITYQFDSPACNCFPSIHCLFCFQVIYMSFTLKNINWKKKLLISIIGLLIVSSTLFVKQHYFYDVVSALGIVIIMNLVGNYLLNISNIPVKLKLKLKNS